MNGNARRAITADRTVAEVTHQHPGTLAVMQRMGIDHCCEAELTLAEAAASAGASLDDLLVALRRAAGETERPSALAEVPESRQVHIDVREEIRGKREPFARIMATVTALAPDQILVLRAPFEPIPLYEVLGKRGLAHWTERQDVDDWRVWFYRGADEPAADQRERSGTSSRSGCRVLDVRGLEPPGPMVRVLEALEDLAPGQKIEVLHERRPMFLYPQLEARGFAHETDEPEQGVVRIVIRRGAAAG